MDADLPRKVWKHRNLAMLGSPYHFDMVMYLYTPNPETWPVFIVVLPRPRVCPRPNSNQSCVRLLHPASSAPRPSRGCASPCAAQNHPAQPPSLSTHNKELGWILSLFSLASPLHNEPHHGGRLPCRPAHLRLYPHRQNGLASSH